MDKKSKIIILISSFLIAVSYSRVMSVLTETDIPGPAILYFIFSWPLVYWTIKIFVRNFHFLDKYFLLLSVIVYLLAIHWVMYQFTYFVPGEPRIIPFKEWFQWYTLQY